MNYREAMSGAEKAGTERRGKRRALYHQIVWSIATLVFVGLAIGMSGGPLKTYLAYQEKEKVIASLQPNQVTGRTTYGILQLAANEKSNRVPVPYQMTITWGGKDFRVHCVYTDGRDVSFGFGDTPCPTGDMPYQYAENIRNDSNVVTWKYVPLK